MEISVADAARARGVSSRRLLQLIHAGRIEARRVAGRYLVEERELYRRPVLGRPMSPRMAWAFIAVLSGQAPEQVNATERHRLQARRERLRVSPDPAALLASWLAARAERRELSVPAGALDGLRADPRVAASGISDPRAGLSAAHQFEGYVRGGEADDVVADHLLIRSTTPNVFLHVANVAVALPAPIGLVLADLADHPGPREDARVRELLEGL
jgi:hypothetical protein